MKNYIDEANNWRSYFKCSLIGEEGNELTNVLMGLKYENDEQTNMQINLSKDSFID